MQPLLRLLRRYARRNVPQYLVGAVMLVVTNWVAVSIPELIGGSLNVLEAGGPEALDSARELAIEIALLGALVIVVRTLSRVLFFNPARDVELRLGIDIFAHLLAMQRPFFMRHKVGELVSLASNDTMAVRLLVGFAILQLFNVAVAVPLHVYKMWGIDPVLTVWCMGPVIVGGIYTQVAVRRFFGMVREGMQLLARLSDRVLECYAGVGTLRAHVAEGHALARFDHDNDELLALQMRVTAVRAFGLPALGLSGLVGTAIVVWVGGDRVLAGKMAIGDMGTFMALLFSLVANLTGLAWVLATISRGAVSLVRVDDVLETEPEVPPITVPAFAPSGPPRLELRQLSFTYPGNDVPALAGIDAVVEPGGTLGIFGKTGSGKTTLVELVARIQCPPAGMVRIDGTDITAVELAALRRCMAVVPQSAFLFSTSLRDNIALPDRPGDVDEARLERVIDDAALRDDLGQLPDGIDTVVGERGVMLSGGQRQRAALARALYRARPLLLLDDVLSAVDQGTEAHMVRAIRRIGGGESTPTTVIVSHRTSVLEHADEIIVLERGHVIERGTHAELVARGGEYAEAHLHQSRAEDA